MLGIRGPQLYPPDMYEERRGRIKSTEGEAHLVEFRASTGVLFGVLVLCLVFSISAMLMWKWCTDEHVPFFTRHNVFAMQFTLHPWRHCWVYVDWHFQSSYSDKEYLLRYRVVR